MSRRGTGCRGGGRGVGGRVSGPPPGLPEGARGRGLLQRLPLVEVLRDPAYLRGCYWVRTIIYIYILYIYICILHIRLLRSSETLRISGAVIWCTLCVHYTRTDAKMRPLAAAAPSNRNGSAAPEPSRQTKPRRTNGRCTLSRRAGRDRGNKSPAAAPGARILGRGREDRKPAIFRGAGEARAPIPAGGGSEMDGGFGEGPGRIRKGGRGGLGRNSVRKLRARQKLRAETPCSAETPCGVSGTAETPCGDGDQHVDQDVRAYITDNIYTYSQII